MQVQDLTQDARLGQGSPERAPAPVAAVSLSAQAAKHAVHAVQTFTALAQICQVGVAATAASGTCLSIFPTHLQLPGMGASAI